VQCAMGHPDRVEDYLVVVLGWCIVSLGM
jgi:hypothetical protein